MGGSVESPFRSDQDARGVSWFTVPGNVLLPTAQDQAHADQDDRCKRPISLRKIFLIRS